MNADDAPFYLPLVAALAARKTIQYRPDPVDWKETDWEDISNPTFTEPAGKYRVKPEPKPPANWWVPLSVLCRCYPEKPKHINTVHVREVLEEKGTS